MVKQRTPSRSRPGVQGDPAAFLGGGFPRRVSTPPRAAGYHANPNGASDAAQGHLAEHLASATPQTGEAAAHPTTWRVFATLSTNLESARPHSPRRMPKKLPR